MFTPSPKPFHRIYHSIKQAVVHSRHSEIHIQRLTWLHELKIMKDRCCYINITRRSLTLLSLQLSLCSLLHFDLSFVFVLLQVPQSRLRAGDPGLIGQLGYHRHRYMSWLMKLQYRDIGCTDIINSISVPFSRSNYFHLVYGKHLIYLFHS